MTTTSNDYDAIAAVFVAWLARYSSERGSVRLAITG